MTRSDSDEIRPMREQLKRSDYGRSEGWDLELEGRVVARLDEPRRQDMFWVSYRLTPITEDELLAAALLTRAFWSGSGWERLIFRSRALGVIASQALPALEPFVEPRRLNMRGLYIAPEPGLLTRLFAWRRRR